MTATATSATVASPPSARTSVRRREDDGGTGPAAADGVVRAAASAPSFGSARSANARSLADWKRSPGCFSRQRAMSVPAPRARPCRSPTPPVRAPQNRRERLGWGGPRKGLTPGNHLVEHTAEREEVRAAIHTGALHLLGRHVADCAQDRAGGGEPPGACLGAVCRTSPLAARPKSRIFTRPSAVRKRLSGFRSRCTIPWPCAAASPPATAAAISAARCHDSRSR